MGVEWKRGVEGRDGREMEVSLLLNSTNVYSVQVADQFCVDLTVRCEGDDPSAMFSWHNVCFTSEGERAARQYVKWLFETTTLVVWLEVHRDGRGYGCLLNRDRISIYVDSSTSDINVQCYHRKHST